MTQEEITKDKKVLEALEAQYKHVRCLVDSVRATITDLDFEKMVPDADERFLMGGQLHAYEAVQDNLRNRIRLYRNRINANKPEPLNIKDWSEFKRTDSTNICVDVSADGDHHCGQDADMDDACCQVREHQPAGLTYKDIIGMEVIGYGGKAMKCEGCPYDHYDAPCVKVELVDGDYICLAKPEQDFTDGKERTTISFDEEEGNVMDDIKEKTKDFLNYLDDIINPKKQ